MRQCPDLHGKAGHVVPFRLKSLLGLGTIPRGNLEVRDSGGYPARNCFREVWLRQQLLAIAGVARAHRDLVVLAGPETIDA